jgi:hypothetical protein
VCVIHGKQAVGIIVSVSVIDWGLKTIQNESDALEMKQLTDQ